MGAEKNKKCIEKISVLVRRSPATQACGINSAEASGNAPIELPLYRSVRGSSEPPRARRVISRGSVQKKLEFQPKGTANLQFQSFWKFYAPAVRSSRLRARMKGLYLQRFATLRVAKKKCFGFEFGSSSCLSGNEYFTRLHTSFAFAKQPIFFCFAFSETWK